MLLDSVECCSAGAGSLRFDEGPRTQSGYDPQETPREFPHIAVNQDLLTHKSGKKDIQLLPMDLIRLLCWINIEERAHCFC